MLDKGAGQQITGEGGLREYRQPLQDNVIYYGAQSVTVVVADTPEQARHAASLVRVTYDEETPGLDLDTAQCQVYPKVFAGTDTMQKSTAKAQKAIEAAPVQVTSQYDSSICHHNPMELLSTIARWEQRDGVTHLHLFETTRGVALLRDVCAKAFHLPRENIHVVSHFLGGAFGSKAWTFF